LSAEARAPLALVANTRLPSQRAQSLQVAQMAAAFARAGAPTSVLYARRRDTPPVGDAAALWDHYEVPRGPRPELEAVACVDWVDRLPRRLQYVPARLQELTFARNAARSVRRRHAGARVYSRELETAHALRGRPGVFLELHRVPGGRTRRRWLRAAAAACSGIVAISEGVREDLVALGVDAARVLVEHDGYEAARFAALPGRAAARAELGLDAHEPLVVYLGGLLAWKGVDLLVEAARGLPGVAFVVAGGMELDVARLRERAAGIPNVRIDGFQPPGRVARYLAAADLAAAPNRSTPAISARYTSPLKVFEAMAAGVPMVCSDLPSLREVLAEDEATFVAPDDAEALGAGIAAALADEAGRAARSARLVARAPRHTWDARAARILDWMEARA